MTAKRLLSIIAMLLFIMISLASCGSKKDNGGNADNDGKNNGTETGGEEEKKEESQPSYKTLKNPEAAKAALEKAGYTVYLRTEGLGDDFEAQLSANKKNDDGSYEMITIVYCANSSVASEQYDVAKESLEAAGDEAEGYTAGRSGTVVWMGTDAAIKAANGKAKPADSNDDGPTDSDDIDNDGWTGGGDENPTYVPCNKSSDAQKALKKAGYETIILGDDSLKYAEGISEILHGSKNDDFVNIYYFESTEYAEQYYEILLEEFLSSGAASNATIGKSGKMIWAGTLTAIKVASGSSGSQLDPDGWTKPD